MSQIALLQWSHGPWTPHMLDVGPTLLLTSPPHCHVQGGLCIIPASWLPGSHSGGLQVLLVKIACMPRCKEAWENESPEGGLCLFWSSIPRYRMGVQGLVPWGGRYKEGSTEGANETCGPHMDMCPIPGKGASEMAHFRKQELGPELRQAWGPDWQAGPGEEGMVGTVSGAGDPTWDWAFRSSGCPGAPDPVPLPGLGTAPYHTASSFLAIPEGPEPRAPRAQGCSVLQLLPAVWGPAVACGPQTPRLTQPPGWLCIPAAGLRGPRGQGSGADHCTPPSGLP